MRQRWRGFVVLAVAAAGACSGTDELIPVDAAAVDAPDIDAPDIDAPDIDAPDIDAPDIDAPNIDAPDIDAPIDAPDIDAPDIDAPDIDAPVDGPVPVPEPMNSLMWIQQRAEAYFQAHGTFPPGTAGFTPAAPCCSGPGMQCPPVLADWAVAPWLDLGFVMTVPFHYRYTYDGTLGSSFVAIARGDLDCDLVSSDFTLTCTSSGSATSCNITVPQIID